MFLRSFTFITATALLASGETPSDGTAIISVSSRGRQLASEVSVSDIDVDIRTIPELLLSALSESSSARRLLTKDVAQAGECLLNPLAVETMSAIGIHAVNTSFCNVTEGKMCEYMKEAGGVLDYDVTCEPNHRMISDANEVPSTSLRSRLLGVDKLSSDIDDLWVRSRYNVRGIQIADAWRAVKAAGRPLREVVVAVMDSGIMADHKDLKEQMFVDDYCHHGFNFVENNFNTSDTDGHGTKCAGVIGAMTGHSKGIAIAGIANVKIMALRMSDWNDRTSLSNTLKALNYAVAKGVDVSSHSYGFPYVFSSIFKKAVQRASAAGHLMIASAGNYDRKRNRWYNMHYPCDFSADVSGLLCVASSDAGDITDKYSNSGKYVSLAAPGVDIITAANNGWYVYSRGTSVAAPHVAGVAAILAGLGLSSQDIRNVLLETVDPMKDSKHFGRLNAKKAVEAALTKPTVAPRPVRSTGDAKCNAKKDRLA